MTEVTQWEYRVRTFGSVWRGIKAEELEQILNEWGEDGWEVVSSYAIENSNKVNIIAKRPLTDSIRRQRSMPRGW